MVELEACREITGPAHSRFQRFESFKLHPDNFTLLGALDPEFVKAFLALKRHEIAKARAAVPGYGGSEWHDRVTDWELDQFLTFA